MTGRWRLIRRSLKTTNQRVASAKKGQLRYELAPGDLRLASKLPLWTVLAAFCRHLQAACTVGISCFI